jgi:hypothetical protein
VSLGLKNQDTQPDEGVHKRGSKHVEGEAPTR